MRFSLLTREIIADSIETVTVAQHHDANVAIPGCDKNMPGVVIAAARHNRPFIMIYGGTIMGGHSTLLGREINISTCYEAHGAFTYGRLHAAPGCKITKTDPKTGKTAAVDPTPSDVLEDIEHHACPGVGACGGMFTANTMATAIEAMGLCLPGSSSFPAVSPEKARECENAAAAIRGVMERDLRPRDLMTRAAFENALAVTMALGGSTNGVLHFLAMASAADVPLTIDDIDRVSNRVPLIADLAPFGKFYMADLYKVGGTPSVLKLLIAARLVDGSIMTVTGRTLGENCAAWPSLDPGQTIIRPLSDPIKPTGHLRILRGNLAPGGAVAKITGKEGLAFTGAVLVFDKEQALLAALHAGRLRADMGPRVVIVRYEGPKGGPGMPEQLNASAAIIGAGLTNIALVTDGRYSGASHGFIVGHVVPEAAVGGPVALVRDGDRLRIDTVHNRIDVIATVEAVAAAGEAAADDYAFEQDPDEVMQVLRVRRAGWTPRPLIPARGVLAKYARLVGDASHGAVTDVAPTASSDTRSW